MASDSRIVTSEVRRVLVSGLLASGALGAACDRDDTRFETRSAFEVSINHVTRLGEPEGPGMLSGTGGALVHKLADGRYAVADQGLPGMVQLFDSGGGYLTSIGGRPGAGPGEFHRSTHVGLHRTGDSLFVFDIALGRLSVFSSEGDRLYDTRMTQAGRPNNVWFLDDGGMLTNAARATEEGAGLPLHLIDPSGQLVHSFGTDFPAWVRMESPTWLRLVAVAADGTLGVVHAYEERLKRWRPAEDSEEPWVLDTTFVIDTSEDFPPVAERHRWARSPTDPPPSPRFRGVWKEDGGPVWLNLLVAHPNYRDRLQDPEHGPWGRERYLADQTQTVTRVLAVDPESGAVIASRDSQERWSPFVGDGEAFSYGLAGEGYVYLDLRRPRLVPWTRILP